MSALTPDVETSSFGDLQATYEDFFVPQFAVTVGDAVYEETHGVLSDLRVDLSLDKATTFSFTLNYPYDPEYGEFEGMDWERFAPDQSVRVEMGYGGTTRPLLHEGRITGVRPDFPSGGSPTITVEGYGLLQKMAEPPAPPGGRNAWTHSWTETAPDAVVQEVVDERGYPFGGVVSEDVGVEPPKIEQKESQHDLDFLLELGETYAYEVFAWEGDLYFRPPRYEGPPDLVLAYGSSLDSFAPEVNEAGQVDKVEVRNWSAEKGEEIVGSAERENVAGSGSSGGGGLGGGSGGGQTTTETFRLPVRTSSEATARAEAVLANRLDGTVSGKGECVGLPEIRPGIRIGVEGLTDRFSTVYYVESATHSFGSSGYRTSFSVKRRGL